MAESVNSASSSGFQKATESWLTTCAVRRQLEGLREMLRSAALVSFENSINSVHDDAIDPTVTLIRESGGALALARQFLVSFGNLSSVRGSEAESAYVGVLAAGHDLVQQMQEVLAWCESAQRTRGQVRGMTAVVRQLEDRLSLLIDGEGQLGELSDSICDSQTLLDAQDW
eukprot:3504341-Rhodomonas_salina.1